MEAAAPVVGSGRINTRAIEPRSLGHSARSVEPFLDSKSRFGCPGAFMSAKFPEFREHEPYRRVRVPPLKFAKWFCPVGLELALWRIFQLQRPGKPGGLCVPAPMIQPAQSCNPRHKRDPKRASNDSMPQAARHIARMFASALTQRRPIAGWKLIHLTWETLNAPAPVHRHKSTCIGACVANLASTMPRKEMCARRPGPVTPASSLLAP